MYSVFYLLEMSDMDLITQELSGVKHKWESIGKGLELDTYAIPIMYSDDGDHLREVLVSSCRGTTPLGGTL